MSAPLEGVRVVEVGELEAMSYCGKLFADFCAEVVKVEGPAGDALRRAPPLDPVTGESGLFAWLNAGKLSVVAAPVGAEDDLSPLLSSADVLLDARDPLAASARHAVLRARHPHLLIVSLSWFGETGPYAGYQGSDSVCRALAGLVKLTGEVEGPPLMLPDHQASVHAGLTAFTAAVAGLYSDDRARRFEVSVFESSVVLQEFPAAAARFVGGVERRMGLNRFPSMYPLGIYPCKEGWLGVSVGKVKHWTDFCELLGFDDWLADPKLQLRPERIARIAQMDPRIAARLKDKTAEAWFELTRARRLPIVVVPTMAELLRQDVHRRAGAFATIDLGGRTFEAPATPLRLMTTPPRTGVAAPGLGATGDLREIDSPKTTLRPKPVHASKPSARPLEGVRVLDLSMGWAGPLATRQLADLGAAIFKIEACAYPDWFRPTITDLDRPHERSLAFAAMNRGKFGATLDLYTPQGVAHVKALLETVDAVVENFSADVMPKLGLTYEAVRAINPSIVMMSMPAFSGHSAWRSVRAYGSTLEHGSGLPTVSGRPTDPPFLNHVAYGDPNGGLNGAAALVTALIHGKRTGQGQYIDQSQVQAMLPLAAPWIIEQSLTGQATRSGNRHPVFSPHGVFPCAGEDQWVVVSATRDQAWPRLCRLIGRDDLAADSSLQTAEARRTREIEIEMAVGAWTVRRSAEEAMAALQAVGVAAGVARTPGELYADPHLLARGSWQVVDRAWSGAQPILSAPFREEGRPYAIAHAAPTLGEHNALILCDHLGLTAAELEDLVASGVAGTNVPDAP